MMKKFKRLLAFAMAMIMCLGMAVTASAEEGKGKITINNATIGQSYTAYRIFEANPSGKNDVIAYIATEEQYNILNAYGDENPFALIKNVEDSYNVSVKDGIKDEDVSNFFYTTDENGVKVPNIALLDSLCLGKKTIEAKSAKVEFEDMDYGYYLITSSLGTTITLTSTNFNAEVIDKNQKGPEWDPDGGKVFTDESGIVLTDNNGKALENNSANYGDVVNFQLRMVNATNYNGEEIITHYFIKDTLAKGMSYVTAAGSTVAEVKVEIKGNGETARELNQNDYSIEMIDNDDDSHSFVITIKWADIANNVATSKYLASPYDITVSYSAIVNEDAELAGTGNKNEAEFGYASVPKDENPDPDPDPSFETIKKSTSTYVFALAINKVDPKGNGLEGAEFTITAEDGSTVYVVGNAGEYKYAKATDPDAKDTVESGEDGLIIIKGVKEGKYTVTETKAPAGYNKLDGTRTIDAVISEASTYEQEIIIYKDADGNVVETEVSEDYNSSVTTEVNVSAINVVNRAGTLLPSTGGIGTTIFYVVGGLLVAGAGILLITKKRMSKEQ